MQFVVACIACARSLTFPRVLVAYSYRHTFITRGPLNGVDSVTLAKLAGHSDSRMISKVYGHVEKQVEFMREQAQKAARGKVGMGLIAYQRSNADC